MKTHWNKKPKQKPNPEYIEWLHAQACYICGQIPTESHHVKKKGQILKDHKLLIPLCPEHHRGEYSPHGRERAKFLKMYPIDPQIELANSLLYEFERLKND